MLTIALSKGRILKQTLPLLQKINLALLDDPFTSRQLIFQSEQQNVRYLILRSSDVPAYVQFGAADLGIVGKDGLMEHGGAGLCELLDLGIAKCRLMTAMHKDASQQRRPIIRVASKYPKITQQFYQQQGRHAKIIQLYGAMELAPLVGLADEIVDLVETGDTLKANGLVAKQTIADISCRLIGNAAAMRVKHTDISRVCEKLTQVSK